MNLKYILKENDLNFSIKEILKNNYNLSTRLYQKLLRHKAIRINNSIFYERQPYELKENDTIEIDLSYEENNSNIVPNNIKLNIVFEDDWILIVNKPTGIPVHPSNLHYEDSLSNGVRAYFDSINLKKKIRPVNRIDLNTSGLVVFAKCEYIHSVLSLQMQNKTFVKKYLCLVEGTFNDKIGIINLPIARKKDSIIERCIDLEHGQKAITHYKVLKEFENLSLVECTLETGRTHQIRVHMAALNHPILGDSLYGNASSLINGQALHSYFISFVHPITNEVLQFTCNPIWKLG